MSWGTVSSRNLGTLLEGKVEEMRQQNLYILNMYIYSQQIQALCLLYYYQSANNFMLTHAIGYVIYGYTLLVPINQRMLFHCYFIYNSVYQWIKEYISLQAALLYT